MTTCHEPTPKKISTLTRTVRPGTADRALRPFWSKNWGDTRLHVRAEPSTHSTVNLSHDPEQPGCSAKMRICEYADDEKVKVLLVVPVRSRTFFVIPPTRRPLVAPSTRAFVVVEESTMVTRDPAAFTPA